MIRPTVAIVFDKERNLCWDMRAALNYEKNTNTNILKDGLPLETLDLNQWTILTWSMLLTDDKSLKLDQVIDWLSPVTMPDVINKISDAIIKSASKDETPPLVARPQPG